jgi:tetratricopeptide (TPR) repeat protein
MQLQLVETSHCAKIKVENGEVMFEDLHVASMDNLTFASENDGYKKMKAELYELPAKIEMLCQRIKKYPDDEDFHNELQVLLIHYNTLKEEFQRHQQALFDTARRISEMQVEAVSYEMRRAIDEFEIGHIEATNAILDGIRNQMNQHKKQTKIDHAILCKDIQVLLLQAKTLMADVNIPIEERIDRILEIYIEADELATLCILEPTIYISLLSDYSSFLETYGLYDENLKISLRLCKLTEEIYDKNDPITADSYNMVGIAYYRLKDYRKAIKYYHKALVINEQAFGEKHINTAISYNNIGNVYYSLKGNNQALDNYKKALAIFLEVLGAKHPTIGGTFLNIGMVYNELGYHDIALEYNFNALRIFEKAFGQYDLQTALSFYFIGIVYYDKKDYDLALDYFMKAIPLYEEFLGFCHPDSSNIYRMLEKVYVRKGDFAMATIYSQKSDLYEMNKPEEKHLNNVAALYKKIGIHYIEKCEYQQALYYYQQALYKDIKRLGKEHLDIACDYYYISTCYNNLEEYDQALEHLFYSLPIWEKLMGMENPNTASIYANIGSLYACLCNYDKAMKYYQKAQAIFEKELGPEHQYTTNNLKNIELLLDKMNKES